MKSLYRLKNMHPEVLRAECPGYIIYRLQIICPGHGPMIYNPEEKIDQYISHRVKRETQIIDILKQVLFIAGRLTTGPLFSARERECSRNHGYAVQQTAQVRSNRRLREHSTDIASANRGWPCNSRRVNRLQVDITSMTRRIKFLI